ncbi:hypothetical protein Tco_1055277 [Tanacetum coccineum]|uniref:Reverse transcriptase Ty1/copia-type domain-containing protein n=1 Tax=Tanacetum coccineum TaxID=301880 RepID=A0ABQ5GZW8_9ASTR
MVEKSKLNEDLQGKPVDATLYRGMIAKPTEKHLNAVKRVFRYLKGTINMGLWYLNDTGMSLTAYADADHPGCQDTRRITSGSAQFLGDILVIYLLVGLPRSKRAQQYRIPLYRDNKSATALCCNNVQHSRVKHIDVRYHFIKEQVENGIVELYFVWTEYQLADIFTKTLAKRKIQFLDRKARYEKHVSENAKTSDGGRG